MLKIINNEFAIIFINLSGNSFIHNADPDTKIYQLQFMIHKV